MWIFGGHYFAAIKFATFCISCENWGYMLRNILLVTMALFLSACSAVAQGFLPKSFGSWNGSGITAFSPSQGGGDARVADAVAKEYDFVSGERGTYTHGTDMVSVTAYEMKDPSGAYGEYSFLRTSDMPRADLAEHSSMTGERALVLVGNVVLDIRGNGLPKLAALKTLVIEANKRAQAGPLPWIGGRLPPDDMLLRSDHYILGPVALNQFFPLGED